MAGGEACLVEGMHGRGAYVVGGMHGRGGGGMCGRVCVVKGGAYVAGRSAWWGDVTCVAGETVTAADGTHPTGMHSCLLKKIWGTNPFCRATVTLVLDCWCCLSQFSKPGYIPLLLCFVACVQQSHTMFTRS